MAKDKTLRKFRIMTMALAAMMVAGALPAWGETVRQKEAARIAQTFFNAANGQVMGKPNLVYNGKKLTTDKLFSPFYVYNLPKGGFVIISAENKAMPILGYSLKDNFDPETMVETTKALLAEYARDIEYIRYDSRIPYEAISAWNYIRDYIGDVIMGRYEFSDFNLKLEDCPDWRFRTFATEFGNLSESDEEVPEEEPRPFALYDDFVAETRAEEQQRMAALEERLLPTEPVVRSVGGGHFEIMLPEDVVMARVYNLQGAQVETRTYKDTNTAIISLDGDPQGFYFVLLNGKSGKPYGIKLWK